MLAERVKDWTKTWEQQGLERGMEQGMEQGLERGRMEGRMEGELQVLRKQLTRRFGPLSEAIESRLSQASSEELERWAENILDAQTLDEVFTQH